MMVMGNFISFTTPESSLRVLLGWGALTWLAAALGLKQSLCFSKLSLLVRLRHARKIRWALPCLPVGWTCFLRVCSEGSGGPKLCQGNAPHPCQNCQNRTNTQTCRHLLALTTHGLISWELGEEWHIWPYDSLFHFPENICSSYFMKKYTVYFYVCFILRSVKTVPVAQ